MVVDEDSMRGRWGKKQVLVDNQHSGKRNKIACKNAGFNPLTKQLFAHI